jgi:tyramine---L-glutamate ligase
VRVDWKRFTLGGPDGAWALPPFRQHLSEDGTFAYQGGSYPLPPALSRRARWLALAAVQSLPSPLGYFGVDLVLGDDATGRDDVVIEINPRLTTSYVGLQAASRVNLAAAMLAVVAGREPELSWRGEPVQFTADGEVTMGSPPA